MGRPPKTPVVAQEAQITPDVAPVDVEEPLIRVHEEEAAKRAAEIKDKIGGKIGRIDQKLPYYGERPGWKRRWVLWDKVPYRVREGYTFVDPKAVRMEADGLGFGNADIGNRVAVPAGRATIGKGDEENMLYLMEIPVEIAKILDYEKSGKAVEASIEALKAGNSGGHVKASDNAYIPKDAPITIR